MILEFSISVPIGAYHPFLRRSLTSLAAQIETAKDFKLSVALLDASGDERVRKIADEFNSILAYRRHGPDDGQSDAILEGWENCPGDILGWLNADDLLFPDALRQVAAAFQANHKLDVVYGHSTILDGDFRTIGYHWAVEPPGPRMVQAGIVSQPSCFFRRRAYESAGGLNRDLHYTMDWDLWIRMYNTGAQFQFLDKTLSMVLWDKATKTASFNKDRRQEINAIIENNLDPETAQRVFRSFAIHHVMERLRPAALKNFATRLLIRGRNTINGISGDGEMKDGAVIALVHYDAEPKSGVMVKMNGASAITGVTCADGKGAKWTRQDDTLIIALARPAGAATTVNLVFAINDAKPPYFVSAEWR